MSHFINRQKELAFLEKAGKKQALDIKFLNLRETFTNVYEDFLKYPFKVMKAEFMKLGKKGIQPILVIDELQALDKVYIDNNKERQLIIALFNFFVP